MTFIQAVEEKAKSLRGMATEEYAKRDRGDKYNKSKIAAWEKFEYYYDLIKTGMFDDVLDYFSPDMGCFRVEYMANLVRRHLAEEPSWREELLASPVGSAFDVDNVLSKGNRKRIRALFQERIDELGQKISVERCELLEAMERLSYAPAMFSRTPMSSKRLKEIGAWNVAEKINRSWYLDDQEYLASQF